MKAAGRAFLDTLRRWLGSGVSGAIEWQHGRKRRLVFLEGHEITMVQSNLRSEGVERLVEQGVAADLIAATRQARLLGLLGEEDGVVLGHPASEPPTREPVPVGLALWEVVEALPALEADAQPRALPAALPLLGSIPWPEGVLAYVSELDGSRTVEDIVDFGPAAPGVMTSALAVASALGAVEVGPAASAQPKILSQGARGDRPSGLFQIKPLDPVTEERELDLDEPEDEQRINAAKNHFEVLDVQWQDPPETVRKAYVALAARLHPDRWVKAPADVRANMERLFDIVRGAWEVLGDPKKREAYTRRVIMGELTEEEKAEQQLQAVLEAERLLTLAQREINAQRIPQAHELLKQALAHDPLYPQVRALAAYCVIRLSADKSAPAVEEAAREIETVAREIAGADWARLLLGRMRLARGDLDGAQNAFIQTLKLNPSNPDALAELKRLRGLKAEKAEESKGFFARLFGR